MNVRDQDYKYDVGLLLFGALIGYLSSTVGGLLLVIVLGIIAAILLGYHANSLSKAMLLGAFFGVVVVISSSPIVQGLTGDFNDNFIETIFIPYFIKAFIAALLTGCIAACSYVFIAKK